MMNMQKSIRGVKVAASRSSSVSRVAQFRTRSYDPETLPTANSPYGQDPYTPPTPVGARVEQWLKTPFDIAAFAPRAAAGVLFTFPERLANLQTDVQKVVELMQDPRPMEDKRDVLLKEVEDTVISLLERGVTVEADVLANLKTVLPAEAAEYLNEFIPEAPNAGSRAPGFDPMDTVDMAASGTGVTYYQADVLANQLASELTEIKAAVTGLKQALESVRTNADVSRTNLLRLGLKEARDLLARRLFEVSPATSSEPSVNAAAREARILLDEVDAQFFV